MSDATHQDILITGTHHVDEEKRARRLATHKRWRARNPDKILAANRRWHERRGRERKRELYQQDAARRSRQIEKSKERFKRLDADVRLLLGGRCVCINPVGCAGADWAVLEIDHIQGDGASDRLGRSRRSAELATRHLKTSGLVSVLRKYQLLCANCHRRKTEMQRAPDYVPLVPDVSWGAPGILRFYERNKRIVECTTPLRGLVHDMNELSKKMMSLRASRREKQLRLFEAYG